MTLSFNNSLKLTLFVAAVVAMAACSNTRLTKAQVNNAHRDHSVSDVLIIMVTDDPELREPFEAGFVAQLRASSVDAVSSKAVIAAPSDQKMGKDIIMDTVNAFQNDAVLISHLVDVEKYDIPDSSTADSGGFYGYYNYAYDYVHAPGLYSTHTHKFVRLETNLYNIRDDSSMWSGQAESSIWHPKSEKRVIDDLIKVVIKDLKRNKLIP